MKFTKIIATTLMTLSLISIAPTYNAFATEDQALMLQHEQDKAFIETCTLVPNSVFGNSNTYEKDGKYYRYTDGLIKRNKTTGKRYAKADGSLAQNEWAYVTYNAGYGKYKSAWRYYGDNFECFSEGYKIIDGKKYFFKKNGDLVTNWYKAYLPKEDDKFVWMYTGESGAIEARWVKSGDDWYYVDENGRMLKNTTVDGYTLDKKGKLVK